MPLDLLVADLLLPHDAPAPLRAMRLPALEKWLARADHEKSPSRGVTQALGSLFGVPSPAPVAAVSLAGERRGAVTGQWLRADPVHLRIDHDYLKLHDASVLDVTREEAAALVATLQSHFAQDGLAFEALHPDRWYVRVPEGEVPKTTPLAEAFGRDVFGLLPEGSGRIRWKSAITEAQMVLGSHAVNVQREAAGKLAINSVWFWGEGAAPPRVEKRYALVYADDAFARGLGALSGADVRPLAVKLSDIDLVRDGDAALAVIDTLTPALHRGDAAAWQGLAETMDARWFHELGEAIGRFGEVRLILPTERETRVASLTRSSHWRWFRARKPLAAHA